MNLIEHIYNELTYQVDYPVHLNWQPTDTEMPFIVLLTDQRETDPPFPLRAGSINFHVFDKSPNALTTYTIRDIIVRLFDQYEFITDEISCRMWLQNENLAPDEPGIWHYIITFTLRLYRIADTSAILDRELY